VSRASFFIWSEFAKKNQKIALKATVLGRFL